MLGRASIGLDVRSDRSDRSDQICAEWKKKRMEEGLEKPLPCTPDTEGGGGASQVEGYLSFSDGNVSHIKLIFPVEITSRGRRGKLKIRTWNELRRNGNLGGRCCKHAGKAPLFPSTLALRNRLFNESFGVNGGEEGPSRRRGEGASEAHSLPLSLQSENSRLLGLIQPN